MYLHLCSDQREKNNYKRSLQIILWIEQPTHSRFLSIFQEFRKYRRKNRLKKKSVLEAKKWIAKNWGTVELGKNISNIKKEIKIGSYSEIR